MLKTFSYCPSLQQLHIVLYVDKTLFDAQIVKKIYYKPADLSFLESSSQVTFVFIAIFYSA